MDASEDKINAILANAYQLTDEMQHYAADKIRLKAANLQARLVNSNTS